MGLTSHWKMFKLTYCSLIVYSCSALFLTPSLTPPSVGMKKPRELFYFFHINNAGLFKKALRRNVISLVTSTAQIISPPASQPLAFLNIAFSQTGLRALRVLDDLGDSTFTAGQWADAPSLHDDTSRWEDVWKDGGIHGVFLIASDDQPKIDKLLSTITRFFGHSISEKTRIQGAARPGNQAGHERKFSVILASLRGVNKHAYIIDFGFLDGISNPAVSGFAVNVLPGQSIVPTGVILARRVGDSGIRARWTRDGSFLVCCLRNLRNKRLAEALLGFPQVAAVRS